MKATNEPSCVAGPMSIPVICQTAMTQHAAASPSVPASAAAVTAAVAREKAAGSARTSPPPAGTGAFWGSAFIIASVVSHRVSTSPEVVGQCTECAVPVAGQRGQELLRYLHRRGAQPVTHP